MKKNDSTILLEVDKLKSDTKRLLHLLKSTEEVITLLICINGIVQRVCRECQFSRR